MKNKIFVVQEQFKKRERRRKIGRFLLGLLGLIGLAPLLGSVIAGWLIPLNSGQLVSSFEIDFPLILIGLGISLLSWLGLKYLWL
jgi:hypothetical protein